MTPKLCRSCGAENPVIANYCARCGHPLAANLIRSATPPSPLMHQWRLLSQKMTRKDVRRILGEPLRIQAAESSKEPERWTYQYEVAARPELRVGGSLEFSNAEGRLLRWDEPDWQKLADK